MFINEEKLNKIIGQNIKYYRLLYSINNKKMTQEQLAENTDVSTALIGNLESSKINQGISIYTLYKISIILNVPIENFFKENNK